MMPTRTRDSRVRGRTLATGAVSLLAACGVLAGCGGSGSGDGTVSLDFTWYGNDSRAEATQEAVDLFEERNPGITVNTSFSGFDAYFEKLSTQVAGGNVPDVVQMDAGYLREYAERGMLRDLDEHVGTEIDIESVDPAGLRSGELPAGRFAVPLGRSTQTMAYNPTIWAEAGLDAPEVGDFTWDDLIEASEIISDSTDGEVVGLTDPGWAVDWFQFFIRQQGRELYTEEGIAFTEEDVADYWNFTQGLRDAGVVTSAEVTSQVNGSVDTSPLVSGRSAAELSYLGSSASLFPTMGEDVALAPWPSNEEGETGIYASTSIQIAIGSRSEHPEEAARLIDFLMNDVEAGQILRTVRGTPPNSEVRAAVAEDLDGVDKILFDFEESMADELSDAPSAPPQGWGSVKRTFTRVYDSINFGELTVDEGAALLMNETEQLIS
ncbi:ABC transporter substrate-binding protein [Actinoalloteichus fjordicus]|nr:extracellular solute-binding protein [Actinoalloteichus fjordicus]